MKKNITTQESHARTIMSIILLLIALLLIDSVAVKIVLAIISALLATTAFLHICPLYTFFKKNSIQEDLTTESVPTISVPAHEDDATIEDTKNDIL